MVTTAFRLEGFRVVKNYGVVRGICVRSRSIVGNFAGALKSIVGGDIGVFKTLCEGARQAAFDEMMQHAAQLGANAILGMRYDANEVMGGITEVLAYGTAVGVEKTSAEDTRGEIGAEDVIPRH